jgi:hypothetical protein
MGLQQIQKRKQKMKTTTLKAAAVFGLGALLAGSAAAQESVSKPVGYETLDLVLGFNYVGLRLHEAPVSSGAVVGDPDGAVVTVTAGALEALVEGQTYIFEVTSGDALGATVLVESFAGDTVTLVDDLSANLEADSEFTIRPSATIASVFGPNNEAGLDGGFFAAGGDQIWVPADGGFVKYYYDGGNSSWTNFETGAIVDGATIDLPYTSGMIIVDTGEPESLVISGSVKLTGTTFGLVGAGSFNYFSSVYPVGATLASFFGAANEAGLDGGFFAAGGDQVWVPNAAGFTKYYYDSGVTSWTNFDTGAGVDAATVELPSSIIIVNDANDNNAAASAPAFYADL